MAPSLHRGLAVYHVTNTSGITDTHSCGSEAQLPLSCMRFVSPTMLACVALVGLSCSTTYVAELDIDTAIAAQGAPVPPASQSSDPDLELDRTCKGHPSANELRERLPSYVKELVVMWPRVGRVSGKDGCRSVARITALNHQGVPITVSFILYDREERPQGQDYRLLADANPARAVMDMVASDEYPHVLVEAAGAPSTSREALEGLLEFLQPEKLVTKLLADP